METNISLPQLLIELNSRDEKRRDVALESARNYLRQSAKRLKMASTLLHPSSYPVKTDTLLRPVYASPTSEIDSHELLRVEISE